MSTLRPPSLAAAIVAQEVRVREGDQRLRQTLRRMRGRLHRVRTPRTGALWRIGALVAGWLFVHSHARRALESTGARPDRFSVLLSALLPALAPVIGVRVAGLLGALAALPVQRGSRAPTVAARVDLNLYAGTWYEIARLPTRHERACIGDVTATYLPDRSGVRVINRCRRAGGRVEAVNGRARVVDRRSRAKLKVTFAPALLRLLPWAWEDYWILDVSPDYGRALVGTPDRRALWVLARKPSLSAAEYHAMLLRAAAEGYDTQCVRPTTHSMR